MKFIIFSVLCVSLSMATSDDINKHWEEFKKHHKKSYSSHEEPLRKELFAKHKAIVNLHNQKHAKGEVPYYIGINQFSDMTESEKEQSFGGRPPNQNPPSFHVRHKRFINESVMWQYNSTDPIFHPFFADDNFTLPASVDLRTTGWSEPVRNQGGCASCYAFAASTSMSYYQFKKTNQSLLFSPQNLVDCADIWGAGKCKGAWSYMVLEYMMIQKQTLEDYYPYLRYSKSCTVPDTAPRYGIDGFVYVNPDVNSLKQAVAQLGAVIISFDATYLLHYAGGIWDGSDPRSSAVCANNKLTHAVALIGYGTDAATNTSYWLLQNSWGSSWGENGYFRMKMNSTDLCGMLSFNFLPA